MHIWQIWKYPMGLRKVYVNDLGVYKYFVKNWKSSWMLPILVKKKMFVIGLINY